jgi:hypothetical protein
LTTNSTTKRLQPRTTYTITENLADTQEDRVDAGMANPPFEPAKAKIQAAVSGQKLMQSLHFEK